MKTSKEEREVPSEDLISYAIELVLQERQSSATFLQRKMGITFALAADITDELEKRGYVGPKVGAKPREILLPTTEGKPLP